MHDAMPDADDLLAAERFLAAEARIAACFERIEEGIAPLLRSMRATGRTTYMTDPERGVIWGHAFLRPPYAPSAEAEWFIGWGLRFPDGGSGWDGADPRLPKTPHAIVALGASGLPRIVPHAASSATLPQGWSLIRGEAAFLAASRPLLDQGSPMALADWTFERVRELRSFLPGLAAA
ncbi:hypothetical protein [Roseomonas sp. AR75]|uniref:hypothetical protein n=1 Tax=Roseomonas sp. AR75 TaxID=2562311 RepID=UPI0010C01A63|nr:hypothetical protein [Roseomonas sp. AR75]